jgi:Uma2 family endonuclease
MSAILTAPAPPDISNRRMTVDEFVAWLGPRPGDERWELIDGRAIMMNPPSPAHNRIAFNLTRLLNEVFESVASNLQAICDIAVRNTGANDFQPIPDIVVIPGLAGTEGWRDNYRLVAEVTSPSNSRREIDAKLERYKLAQDNRYILLIDSRQIAVEVLAKAEDWRSQRFNKLADKIELPEFKFSCHVGDLYRLTYLVPPK